MFDKIKYFLYKDRFYTQDYSAENKTLTITNSSLGDKWADREFVVSGIRSKNPFKVYQAWKYQHIWMNGRFDGIAMAKRGDV